MRNVFGVFGFAVCAAVAGVAKGQLVINEVDYDQTATDTAEFVEIYNPSSSPVNLTGYELVLLNGSSNPAATYLRVQLAPLVSLQGGGYLVVGAATVQASLPPGTPFIAFSLPSNNIQNGAPDGIALINTATMTVIDTLSYEGSITQANVTGFTPSPFNLVQGTATPLADPNSGEFSLQRTPNGRHSGDDASDWALDVPTPGRANTGSTACVAPVSTTAFAPDAVCPGVTKSFTATFTGTEPLTCVWTLDSSPVNLSDPRISVVSAGGTSTLTITGVVKADQGRYQCGATNACGSAPTGVGLLLVSPADIGMQGGVPGSDGLYDNNDFIVFIDAFFNQLPSADLGQQGGVFGPDGQFDNNDFIVFINFFFAGCP